MKKNNRLIIVFLIILIAYQLFFSILKSEHKSVYKIVKNKDEYNIDENYYRSDDKDYYYINVEYADDNYIFTIDNVFHKSRNIVKNVLRYELQHATCMVLELSNQEYSEPMCLQGKKLYSYLAIKDEIGNDELDAFYYNKSYNDERIKNIGEGKIIANGNHFDEGEYLAVYNEKEIIINTISFLISFIFNWPCRLYKD